MWKLTAALHITLQNEDDHKNVIRFYGTVVQRLVYAASVHPFGPSKVCVPQVLPKRCSSLNFAWVKNVRKGGALNLNFKRTVLSDNF